MPEALSAALSKIGEASRATSWYSDFLFDHQAFWENELLSQSVKRRARFILNNRADYHKKLGTLYQLMDLPENGNLLSVGAGTGLDLLEWGRRKIQSSALEISPDLVSGLKQLYELHSSPVTVKLGRAEKMDFPDQSFDCVFTENAYEHFAYPIQALMEQYRVLKPGGTLLIVDGNLLQVVRVYTQIFKEPANTDGRAGGFSWLWKKSTPRDVYGSGYICRDEDWHTPAWWRQRLIDAGFEKIEAATTSRLYHPSRPGFLHPFMGQCLVVAKKPL